MPLPQWDEITAAPEWEAIRDKPDLQHKVFRKYLTDLSKLPEWEALKDRPDLKFKIIDRMQKDGGMQLPDEAVSSISSDLWKTAKETAKEVGKGVGGAAEVVGGMATGMIAPVVGGFVGLATAPFYGTEGATKAIEEVQSYLSYKPMTESGKAATEQLGKVFDFLIGKPTSNIGDLAKAISEPIAGEDVSSWVGAGAKAVSELIGYIALFETAQAPIRAKMKAGKPLTPAEKAVFEDHLNKTGELAKAISEDLQILAKERKSLSAGAEKAALPPGTTRPSLAPGVEGVPPEGGLTITRIPGEGFVIERGGTTKVIRRPGSPTPETRYFKKNAQGVYEYTPGELLKKTPPPEAQRVLPRGALEMPPGEAPKAGEEIANFLGVRYEGEQPTVTKARPDSPPTHLFTDTQEGASKGATFAVDKLTPEAVSDKLTKVRQRFGEAPVKPTQTSLTNMAKTLVESKTREEIRTKLEDVFGTYKELDNLQSMVEGGQRVPPMDRQRLKLADEFMADVEKAAVERDYTEVSRLLAQIEKRARGVKSSFWKELNDALGDKGLVGKQGPKTPAQIEAMNRLNGRVNALIEEARKVGKDTADDIANWAIAQGLNPELKDALRMTVRRIQEVERPAGPPIKDVIGKVAKGDRSALPAVKKLAEELGPDAAHHEIINGALAEAAKNGTLDRMRKIEGKVKEVIGGEARRAVEHEVLAKGTVQDIIGTSFILKDGQRVGGPGGVHSHFDVMTRATALKKMAVEGVSPHLIEKKFLGETGAVRTVADMPSSTILYFTGESTPTFKQMSSMLRGWVEFRKDMGGRANVIIERINEKGNMTSMATDRPTLETIEGFFKSKKSAVRQVIDDVNTLFIKGEKGSIGGDLSMEQLRARARLRTNIKAMAEEARRSGKESVDDIADWIITRGIDPQHRPFVLEALRESKYAKAINLEKQNIPEELKEVERAATEGRAKKVQTWDEAGKLSEKLRADYEEMAKVVNKAKKGGALKAEEIDALRQVNVNAIDRLKEIVDLSPGKFNEEFMKYQEGIFKATSDAASTVGRALNIHKKEISIKRMTDAFAELKRGLNERELKEFKELNFEDPNQVKAFVERLGDPTLRDYMMEFWYNSILSGPPTHLVNVASNTLWAMYQVPHRGLTGVMDAMGSILTGRPREIFMSEVVPMLAGYEKGWKRGAGHAKEVIITGRSTSFETKWNLDIGTRTMSAFERSPYALIRKAAPYLTAPTRALRAADVWANSMAFDAQMGALARRAGLKKGLSGDVLKKFEAAFLKSPTEQILREASLFAQHSTFMDEPGKFTKWIIQGRSGIGEYASTGFRFIVPFVNTIANLMKRGVEFIPGAGAVLMKREGRIAPEILAKQMEGSILTLYIMHKLDMGEITGPAPTNVTERDAFYREGKLPWAIKVGDTYHQYRRVEPFATPIAMAAVAYDKIKTAKDDATAAEIFMNAGAGMVEYGLDSSYMQGLNNIFDKYGRRKGIFPRLLASFVPMSSFWRSMGRAYEAATEGSAKVRDTSNLIGALSQTLPGGTELAKPKLNVWGEEIILPGGVFRQWLPFKWSEESADSVEKEFERLKYYPSLPDKFTRIKGESVEIPDDLYREYAISYGHKAKADVTETIKEDWYKRRSDEDKLKILDKRLSAIRDRGMAEVRRRMKQ